MTELKIRREAPHCAIVEDIALWRPASTAVADELRALLAQTGVVVFRRQSLGEEELVRVAGMFGEVEASLRYDWASPTNRAVGYISNLRDAEGRAIGGLGSNEVVWHCDQSYVANPATGAMLYCVEAPADAARTFWADLKAAYAALPAATRQRFDNLVTVFDYAKRTASYEQGSRPGADIENRTPPVRHRLVNHQPATGAQSLYLDPATAVGIDGMPAAEAAALLDELAAHATQPQFLYTHHWQPGDVVVWDNAVTLHRREPFDPRRPRLLKRLQFRPPRQEFICPD